MGRVAGQNSALFSSDKLKFVATTTYLVSGSADNKAKLWDVSNGTCLKSWEFNTAVRAIKFSEDDKKILVITEPRMGFPGTVQIFDVDNIDSDPGTVLLRLLRLPQGEEGKRYQEKCCAS